ncbi:MAG: hypothetical protein ACYCSQ_02855 [bacterium]
MGANNNYSENKAGLSLLIKELLLEAVEVKEEDFKKWYEKKRKIFNTGIKKPPTKEEFIKYLNYALSLKSEDKYGSFDS